MHKLRLRAGQIALVATVAFVFQQAYSQETMSLSGFAGRYTSSHRVGLESNGTFFDMTVQDRLDVVKLSQKTAYISVSTLYNSGGCSFHGIADWKDGALIYRSTSSNADKQCVLRVGASNGKLVLTDENGNCQLKYCRKEASFEKSQFELGSVMPIKNLDEVLSSADFKRAERGYRAK